MPAKTHCSRLWKVAGAFVNPKDITLNSKCPLGVENAVFPLSSGATSTCKYLDVRSRAVNNVESARESRVASFYMW